MAPFRHDQRVPSGGLTHNQAKAWFKNSFDQVFMTLPLYIFYIELSGKEIEHPRSGRVGTRTHACQRKVTSGTYPILCRRPREFNKIRRTKRLRRRRPCLIPLHMPKHLCFKRNQLQAKNAIPFWDVFIHIVSISGCRRPADFPSLQFRQVGHPLIGRAAAYPRPLRPAAGRAGEHHVHRPINAGGPINPVEVSGEVLPPADIRHRLAGLMAVRIGEQPPELLAVGARDHPGAVQPGQRQPYAPRPLHDSAAPLMRGILQRQQGERRQSLGIESGHAP